MKKSILPLVAFGLATSSLAQNLELKPIQKSKEFEYSILPAKYTCNGHDLLIRRDGVSEMDNADASIVVMDANLNETKRFSLTEYTNSNVICWRDTVCTHISDKDFRDEGPTKIFLTSGMFQSLPDSYYFSIINGGISWSYFGGEQPFYLDEDFKLNFVTKTPERVEVKYEGTMILDDNASLGESSISNRYPVKGTIVLKDPTFNDVESDGKKQYNLQIVHDMELYKLSHGEWKERVERGWKDCALNQLSIRNANAGEQIIYASQNIFNDDESYEWIEEMVEPYQRIQSEQDRDDDGEIDYRTLYRGYSKVGWRIMQENGNILAEIKFGEGRSSYGPPVLLDFAGKKYLEISTCGEMDSNVEYQLYEITSTGSSTSLKKVRTDYGRITASPAFAKQNEIITIDLSNAKGAKELSMVSGNGRVVLQQKLKEGQKQITMHTSGLAAGMYVIKVSDGKNTTENCKIVIR